LPNAYLPELIESNGLAAVSAILESHSISPIALEILLRKPFTSADFEDFIAERQRTLQEAIEDLLIKERLDLSPQLRELDDRIEKIELALRDVVATGLDGKAKELPARVRDDVEEKIQKAAQKNAAMDVERYKTLEGKLDYFDLRELQSTITNGGLWPRFEARFANKSALDTKFDQLAELRNGIAHHRAVAQVPRMEGEAAILWFEQVLAK
jgi:hypothetical protein